MQNITSVVHGQTPTNINSSFEDGEWWVRGNADGGRRRVDPHNNKNHKRMFVDGKSTVGCVYVIKNPAWPEWVKVGKAVDAQDRLNSYQTSDPFRSYILHHHIEVKDRHITELQVHQELGAVSLERHNEWFRITADDAAVVLNTHN